MLNLLLIAPTCDGQDVGESWVSYQWVRTLAERHKITVLTYHQRGHTPLSAQLPGIRVVEWAEPAGLGRAARLNSLMKPAYVPFWLRARRWLRCALAQGERFDLAHQLAPVALRYPSPAAGLGLPFVLGPVGGSLPSPPGFRAEENTSGWYMRLRELDGLRLRRDPWLRATYRQAACVIGIAPYVAGILAGTGVRRFEVMSDTGIERMPEPPARPGGTGEMRLLFTGRVIRTKGTRDAIRALALARGLPATLDVVGDGFDRDECERLAVRLGLAGRVRFHGWLPRPRVGEFYRSADVFVFPSYREPGGTVIFEAASHGLPLLVSDRGGPGYVVDETCGLRVSPHTPQQYAQDLAAALTRLAGDPALRARLGAGARHRAAQLGLWDSKMARMEEIYSSVLAEARPRSRQPTAGHGRSRSGASSPGASSSGASSPGASGSGAQR